jgi:hemerythrin
MTWILWDNTLETGQARMDEDHRELARLFDLLSEAVAQRREREFCSSVVDQIIEHARTHFELEQQFMAERHYPKIKQHTAEHDMLLAQALECRAAFDAGDGPKIALADFPDVWLSFHILFSDKDLAQFLAQTG